jgi:HEAT repeat protein
LPADDTRFSRDLRLEPVDALERVKELARNEDVQGLVRELDNPMLFGSMEVRGWAARALGDLRDPAATAALTRLLEDESENVRVFAAEALGKIADRDAVPGLLNSLTDESDLVRAWVVDALGRAGDATVAPRLAGLLENPDVRVRRAAVLALGRLGDASSIPALRAGLDRERWGRRGPYRRAIREIAGRSPS